MNKRIASLVLATGLAGGGAFGMLLGTPGISSAQTAESTPAVTADPAAPTAGAVTARPDRGTIVADALKTLVANGTITQTQSDAVTAALKAAAPEGLGGGKGGRGGAGRGMHAEAVATVLGMTAAEVKIAVDGGQTIAQIAASKGIDVAKVVDTLLSEFTAKEQAEVATGEHTQAEVDQKIVDAKARITDMVNGTAPTGGRGEGGKGGPGGHGPRGAKGQAPAVAPAAPAAGTSTSVVTS